MQGGQLSEFPIPTGIRAALKGESTGISGARSGGAASGGEGGRQSCQEGVQLSPEERTYQVGLYDQEIRQGGEGGREQQILVGGEFGKAVTERDLDKIGVRRGEDEDQATGTSGGAGDPNLTDKDLHSFR
jgi:hypothetical protein